MAAPITPRDAVLQALSGGPSYGLEIIDRVREATSGGIILGQAEIYPLLRKLEREGLLRSWEADPLPERGGRPRRYYEIVKKVPHV